MKSCLYSCDIYHDRRRPRVHAFTYRLFMFCIDLDETELLYRNPLIDAFGSGLYSLRVGDHLRMGASSIKGNLIRYLRTQGYTGTIGRVLLLTNLRTLGYLFNPVSFYFVEDATGQEACVLAEVANTFNEQKLYFLGPDTIHHGRFKDDRKKAFYISPFSDAGTTLHFSLRFPEDDLRIAINQSDADGIYFRSGMKGHRIALTTLNLARQTLRFPWVTLQSMAGIHWHALLLFLKKVPFRRKDEQPELQRGIRTYLDHRQNPSPEPVI